MEHVSALFTGRLSAGVKEAIQDVQHIILNPSGKKPDLPAHIAKLQKSSEPYSKVECNTKPTRCHVVETSPTKFELDKSVKWSRIIFDKTSANAWLSILERAGGEATLYCGGDEATPYCDVRQDFDYMSYVDFIKGEKLGSQSTDSVPQHIKSNGEQQCGDWKADEISTFLESVNIPDSESQPLTEDGEWIDPTIPKPCGPNTLECDSENDGTSRFQRPLGPRGVHSYPRRGLAWGDRNLDADSERELWIALQEIEQEVMEKAMMNGELDRKLANNLEREWWIAYRAYQKSDNELASVAEILEKAGPDGVSFSLPTCLGSKEDIHIPVCFQKALPASKQVNTMSSETTPAQFLLSMSMYIFIGIMLAVTITRRFLRHPVGVEEDVDRGQSHGLMTSARNGKKGKKEKKEKRENREKKEMKEKKGRGDLFKIYFETIVRAARQPPIFWTIGMETVAWVNKINDAAMIKLYTMSSGPCNWLENKLREQRLKRNKKDYCCEGAKHYAEEAPWLNLERQKLLEVNETLQAITEEMTAIAKDIKRSQASSKAPIPEKNLSNSIATALKSNLDRANRGDRRSQPMFIPCFPTAALRREEAEKESEELSREEYKSMAEDLGAAIMNEQSSVQQKVSSLLRGMQQPSALNQQQATTSKIPVPTKDNKSTKKGKGRALAVEEDELITTIEGCTKRQKQDRMQSEIPKEKGSCCCGGNDKDCRLLTDLWVDQAVEPGYFPQDSLTRYRKEGHLSPPTSLFSKRSDDIEKKSTQKTESSKKSAETAAMSEVLTHQPGSYLHILQKLREIVSLDKYAEKKLIYMIMVESAVLDFYDRFAWQLRDKASLEVLTQIAIALRDEIKEIKEREYVESKEREKRKAAIETCKQYNQMISEGKSSQDAMKVLISSEDLTNPADSKSYSYIIHQLEDIVKFDTAAENDLLSLVMLEPEVSKFYQRHAWQLRDKASPTILRRAAIDLRVKIIQKSEDKEATKEKRQQEKRVAFKEACHRYKQITAKGKSSEEAMKVLLSGEANDQAHDERKVHFNDTLTVSKKDELLVFPRITIQSASEDKDTSAAKSEEPVNLTVDDSHTFGPGPAIYTWPSTNARADFQSQMKLLEQQNKARLMRARAEQSQSQNAARNAVSEPFVEIDLGSGTVEHIEYKYDEDEAKEDDSPKKDEEDDEWVPVESADHESK